MNEWISVKDRLPEKIGTYLAWIISPGTGKGEVFPVEFRRKKFVTGWKLTHWMPLPEPPKAGK